MSFSTHIPILPRLVGLLAVLTVSIGLIWGSAAIAQEEDEADDNDAPDFFDTLQIKPAADEKPIKDEGDNSQDDQGETNEGPVDPSEIDLDALLLDDEVKEEEDVSVQSLDDPDRNMDNRPEFVNPVWNVGVFRGLDKVTGRVTVFEAFLNEPARFHRIELLMRRCNKRPPEETPETTAFAEVIENNLDGGRSDIFKGWLFASSPGLSAVEHPVYDVWLLDCKKVNRPVLPDPAAEATMDADADIMNPGGEAVPDAEEKSELPSSFQSPTLNRP